MAKDLAIFDGEFRKKEFEEIFTEEKDSVSKDGCLIECFDCGEEMRPESVASVAS